MPKKDLYEVLGVGRDASDADIKKSYRRLAMKHHPDRNPGDAEAEVAFKEAKEAYEILSDSRKRAAYDRFGHAGVDQQAGMGGGFGAADFGDIFGDVFGDIFGTRGRGQSNVYRGADLRHELALELGEAVFGSTVNVEIPTFAVCDSCSGSGAAPGTSPVTCSTCGGQGQVRRQQGFFSIQQTCPTCRGTGRMIENPCGDCHGAGRRRKNKTLSVKVPPGVDTGDRIRLSGEGEAGENGGPPGDLYVDIRVRPHEIFEREGADLSCVVPISFATAVLGGSVAVPTLNGEVSLKVPAETQSGKVFRIRGKGVRPVRSHATGDLYCRVDVETPVKLSNEQKDMVRRFDESLQAGDDRHRPRASSWRDGVRRFFENIGY